MKKLNLSAVAVSLLAGSTVALGAPRESVTFTAVSSNGRINDAANTVLTHTFTGTDAGGAYNAVYLTVSGSHTEVNTATLQSEAAILITPPSGQPFICRPITTSVTGTENIPAGAFVIPVSTFTTAGQWNFRFFETFDDGATTSIDGTWDTITFTLEDAAHPTGANPGAGFNQTLTNVTVDGTQTAPTTVTFTAPAGAPAGLIRLSGVGTGRTSDPAANLNINPLSRARFQLVAPNGAVSSIAQPWGTLTQSSSTAEAIAFLPGVTPAAGTWTLRTWDTGNFAGVDNTLQSLTVSFLDAPATPSPVDALPALVDGSFVSVSNVNINAGEIKWFSMVVPQAITAADFRGLDVDTEGSTTGDTGLSLYGATGQFILTDLSDGTDLLSAMSFGRTSPTRPAPGNGVAYNGRDGELAAGTYFIAVSSGGITNDAAVPFGALTTSTLSGTVNVNARYIADTGGRPPASAQQITLTEGTWSTGTQALNNGIAWFFFDLPAMPAGSALDIDTTGSNLSPANDTAIALYRGTTGAVEDQDNNDGLGLLSALSYGAGTTTARNSSSGVRFQGRDGTASGLGAPQRYYLAVVGGDAQTVAPATFQGGFVIDNAPSANTGNVTARVRFWTVNPELDPTPVASTIALADGGAWATGTATVAPSDIAWFTFTTPSLTSTGALDIDTFGSNLAPLNDTEIGLYGATGTLIDSDDDDSDGQLSQLSYGSGRRNGSGNGLRFIGQDGTTAGTAGNIGPDTQYYLAVGTGTSFSNGSTFNSLPNAGALNSGTVTARVRAWAANAPTDPLTPPAAETLNLVLNSQVSDTETVAVGGVKWYTFNVPQEISATANRALSIDTEGSTTNPTVSDTSIALFTAVGALRASDAADGSDSLGMLTFGADSRPAPSNGLAYNGRDGLLAAGQYYLAVLPGGAPAFAADFGVTGQSLTQNGEVTVNVNYRDPGVDPTGITPPAEVTELGNVGTTNGQERVTTNTFTVADGNTVKWFRFTLGSAVTGAGNLYLDIDTEGTGVGIPVLMGNLNDTEIGLFSAPLGFNHANDDDDGSGQRSAISFGNTAAPRPGIATAPDAVDVARNGRDGDLTAGTYFVSVSTFNTEFSPFGYTITLPSDRAGSTGDRVLNIRTNVPGGPTACGPSDVAGQGQTLGADGTLSADDIIVFIGWFFASDARADIAGQGQTVGADGNFTADDIILFINRFFAGC
jgi:hypothetical protein